MAEETHPLAVGLSEREAETRLLGESRGFDHANYVDAYGGEIGEEPTDMPGWVEADETLVMWFRDGWTRGVERFEREQEESDN